MGHRGKIHRFGSSTRRRRREECEDRTKDPLERGDTGIRSRVRYKMQKAEDALKIQGLPEQLVSWLKRRRGTTT